MPIPPPHAPPPPTMRMTTRDSNRLKRFSAYGVIDTAAALAGKEDALIAAALAVEDKRETDEAKMVLQNSSVILTEEDTALAEAAFAKCTQDDEESDEPSAKPVKGKGKTKDTPTPSESATKRRRRTTSQVGPTEEEPQEFGELPASPTTSTGRKRSSKPQSPRPSELKRMSVDPPTQMLSSFNQEAYQTIANPSASSLSELGSVSFSPLICLA